MPIFSYFSAMIKIGIIGSGNVASHLSRAFSSAPGLTFTGVYARTPEKLRDFTDSICNDVNELDHCDLVILAVADDAIPDVSAGLPFSGKLVAHTSGSRPLEDIGPNNRQASFYPLQTFSRSRTLDYARIPVCIEAHSDQDYEILKIAGSAFGEVRKIDSAQRRALHLSAVFACNFTNHMYTLAHRLCSDNNVPFSMLHPLIQETAQKIMSLEPAAAQTGPAVRGDQKTISTHLEMLKDERLRSLYSAISQSIGYESKKL